MRVGRNGYQHVLRGNFEKGSLTYFDFLNTFEFGANPEITYAPTLRLEKYYPRSMYSSSFTRTSVGLIVRWHLSAKGMLMINPEVILDGGYEHDAPDLRFMARYGLRL